MSSLTNEALYGGYTPPPMGAQMLNPASNSPDFMTIFTTGLSGAASGAINAYAQERAIERGMVAAEYDRQQSTNIIVVLALLWLVTQ